MAKYTKRRDKRGYEWKSAYREKEALMLERGYLEVSPHDFYRELFPAGSLQQEPEDGKGNIIATQIRPSGRGRTRQWVIDDSLKMLDKVIGDRFGLIPPISFYGKSHTKENAHELFAVVVDVDYVGKQQLKNLLKQFGNGVQLRPTYLVSSGKGVHLYYFLQEQVQLYRNREEVLAELKEALIRRLWNDTSSIRPDSPDITGIYQGFRCVGSQSKLGADFPVKAYKLSENRYTLEDIKASIPSCKVDLAPLYEKPRRKSTVTLEEAKELYPEWYEKRIVQGEPKQKSKKQGGTWVCNEALYEWWKRKITEEVKAGGRYFSIMALCSYGLKCGISEQKIRRDAYAFLDHLESLTEDEDNHFSRADVKDALRALKGDRKRLSTIASREWIEDNTKVTIPANKRNYRKQEAHLYLARRKKEDMKVIGEVVKEGRPTAERTVREWQESHPTGKKADCIRETVFNHICPKCGSKYIGAFKAGTEKVEEETRKIFPHASVLRMDLDTTSGKEGHRNILEKFASHEADILIGTQMIVKGHDFADVTLVGILLADMSLHCSDYRAAEITFDLLTQAAGRAGRGDRKGNVVIQTYDPEHYSIVHAAGQDYDAFYDEEMGYRELMGYPPSNHMMAVRISCADADLATKLSDELYKLTSVDDRVNIIGPADAAVYKINDIYNRVIYYKCRDYALLIQIKDIIENYLKRDVPCYKECHVVFDFR